MPPQAPKPPWWATYSEDDPSNFGLFGPTPPAVPPAAPPSAPSAPAPMQPSVPRSPFMPTSPVLADAPGIGAHAMAASPSAAPSPTGMLPPPPPAPKVAPPRGYVPDTSLIYAPQDDPVPLSEPPPAVKSLLSMVAPKMDYTFPTPGPTPEMQAQQQESLGILNRPAMNDVHPSGRFARILQSKDQFGDPDADFMNRAIDAVDPGVREMAGLRNAIERGGIASQAARAGKLGQDLTFAEPEAGVADYTSERTAARSFLPGASAVHARERGETASDLMSRYIEPERTRADAVLGAAGLQADAATTAARTAAAVRGTGPKEKAIEGLFKNVFPSYIEKGDMFTPPSPREPKGSPGYQQVISILGIMRGMGIDITPDEVFSRMPQPVR